MGLCVAFIAFVRLPSLKVSTLLLTGLLVYDVFWVFFSSYIFNANVMVKVSCFIRHAGMADMAGKAGKAGKAGGGDRISPAL